MKFLFSVPPLALLLGFLALAFSSAFTPASGTITFHVSGINNAKGVVRVVLYDSDKNFLSENGFAIADSAFANVNGTVAVTLNHVPFGTYAAAIYQDENQNGVIDQNMIRVPTEPYAFSNGVRAKWSVPKFQEVAFQFDRSSAQFYAILRDWSKQ